MAVATRREDILRAALEAFVEKGFAAATIDDVRGRSGASTGSIYHHFGGKEGLAAALYVDGLGGYQRGFIERLRRARDAEAAVKSLVRHHLRWVEDNPNMARFILGRRETEALAATEQPMRELNRGLPRGGERAARALVARGEPGGCRWTSSTPCCSAPATSSRGTGWPGEPRPRFRGAVAGRGGLAGAARGRSLTWQPATPRPLRRAHADHAELPVLVEREGAHAVVTLNDPEKLNPLSAAHGPTARGAHGPRGRRVAAGDRPDRRGSRLLGGRRPAADARHRPPDARRRRRRTRDLALDPMEFGAIARLITRTDKAFVAAVGGAAAGVGLAFALACDLILVSERARLVPAFGRIGLLPEVGTSWLLTRRLGYQRTFELFAGGRVLDGEEAAQPASRTPWFPTTGSWTRRSTGAAGSRSCPRTWRR